MACLGTFQKWKNINVCNRKIGNVTDTTISKQYREAEEEARNKVGCFKEVTEMIKNS